MSPEPPRLPICPSDALDEGGWLKRTIVFEGRTEECLVLRHAGQVQAYLNRCVHMPRALDCEQDMIFDPSGRYLRCSMHGIIYAPDSGTSLSVMCEGERLKRVAIIEADDMILFADHRVALPVEG
ncbi:MAG: Rieske 2Fe-2S domain-containing protein [Rhodocyclaceae bacterium]|nr:Rieske 2Fe-2S domain-containing protein [Rhodocyclaceae bacterium]